MAIYNTNGRGLTQGEEQTLKYLYYDPDSNKFKNANSKRRAR